MDIIRRIAGVYLIASGLAGGALTIVETLFHDIDAAMGYSPLWLYIDAATAVGIALALLFALLSKFAMQRNAGNRSNGGNGGGITRDYLEANVRFYGLLLVALLFYRLWFGDLTGNGGFPVAADVTWGIVYGLYVMLAVSLGIDLARGRRPAG